MLDTRARVRASENAALINQLIAKAQPSLGDVHINRPLVDVSVAYMQSDTEMIATRMFPQVSVQKRSDLFYVYSRADWYRSEARRRAPGTESAGSGWNLTTQSYSCDRWAIHKDVSDDIRQNSDQALNPDMEATEYVTQQCMLAREIVWTDSYFAAGIWGTDTTPGTLWDAANSTPIEDIRAQIYNVKAATGYKPNVLALSPRVWLVLQDHPDFTGRINSGQTPGGPAIVNLQTLAAVLELQEVMIAWGVRNTAIEGAAEATDFIVGNHALLAYRAPSPGLMTPSAGYTFAWTGLLGAGAFGNRIKTFRLEREEVDRVECDLAFQCNVVAPELGVLFEDPIS